MTKTNIQKSKIFYTSGIFFLILTSYYILRPIRDEMGILAGINKIPSLFLYSLIGTVCLSPIFSYYSHTIPKAIFSIRVYLIVSAQTLIFYILFQLGYPIETLASCYFVWLSIINLFIVSLFWSIVVDLFTINESKLVFGYIAAGGTLGAIFGPSITVILASHTGTISLLIPAGILFLITAVTIHKTYLIFEPTRLVTKGSNSSTVQNAFSKSFKGIKLIINSPFLQNICWYNILNSIAATFIYISQASLLTEISTLDGERTAFFATIDFFSNITTLLFQVLLTKSILTRIGVTTGLMLLPIFLLSGFILSVFTTSVLVLAFMEILRRSINYAFAKPSREVLFTLVSNDEKYASKNTIDTFVYRLGDSVGAQLIDLAKHVFTNLPVGLYMGVPICIIWGWVIKRLGHQFNQLQTTARNDEQN